MLTRYDAVYYAALPFFLPYLGYRSLAKRKYRESTRGMLGLDLPIGANREAYRQGSLWCHAVSVGETVALKSIAPYLRRHVPELPFIATTITETGQNHAHKILHEADTIHYFPLDFSWNVRRFHRCFNPRIFVMMETELWPNFLITGAQRGCANFMLNGKLSDRSFRRYRAVRRLLKPAFDSIRAFCMQSEEDAEKMRQLCQRPQDVHITGNCKFDAPMRPLDLEVAQIARQQYQLGPSQRPRIVVGSTHPGEEEIILNTFRQTRKTIPDLQMILSPRHPERFHEVYQMCRRQPDQWTISRATTARTPSPDIFILDTMGELARTYGLGDIAIVAGSFSPHIGGHNILEAAAHGIPVIVGPHMHAQKELNRLFHDKESGLIRCTPQTLTATLIQLLKDPGLRARHGQQLRTRAHSHQGSARKSIEAIAPYIQKTQKTT